MLFDHKEKINIIFLNRPGHADESGLDKNWKKRNGIKNYLWINNDCCTPFMQQFIRLITQSILRTTREDNNRV